MQGAGKENDVAKDAIVPLWFAASRMTRRQTQHVGWVEFHETHQLPGFMVGLAGLDPPYGLTRGVEALQAAPTVRPAGFVEESHQTVLRLGSTRRTGR